LKLLQNCLETNNENIVIDSKLTKDKIHILSDEKILNSLSEAISDANNALNENISITNIPNKSDISKMLKYDDNNLYKHDYNFDNMTLVHNKINSKDKSPKNILLDRSSNIVNKIQENKKIEKESIKIKNNKKDVKNKLLFQLNVEVGNNKTEKITVRANDSLKNLAQKFSISHKLTVAKSNKL